jgi:hypothetical protein
MSDNRTMSLADSDIGRAMALPRLDLAAAKTMRRGSWLARILARRQPTTFQRCLAVHIHFAGPHSALH